jgi:uncharacterized protein (UPF0548 family)
MGAAFAIHRQVVVSPWWLLAWEHHTVTGRPLAATEERRLRAAAFTYPGVGSTLTGDPPAGHLVLRRSLAIGSGTERFVRAVDAVLGWEMHRRAGLMVRSSDLRVFPDAVAVVRLGPRWLGVDAPVRVVDLVEESHRRGFAYGTLPGHPESGEEAFVVEMHADRSVTFTVTAFSRPATALARLSGPLGRAVQGHLTNRYLRAV